MNYLVNTPVAPWTPTPTSNNCVRAKGQGECGTAKLHDDYEPLPVIARSVLLSRFNYHVNLTNCPPEGTVPHKVLITPVLFTWSVIMDTQ